MPCCPHSSLPPRIQQTSQADSETAHDELKDIVLHVMDYRYRAVRKRLKQLKEKGEPMTTSKWRKAATLPRIQHR